MFDGLNLWWHTQVLRKVMYKSNGRPHDCKGLQFKGDTPFGENTEYYITSSWAGYSYLGQGKYTNWKSLHSDILNPYYKENLIKIKKAFMKKGTSA